MTTTWILINIAMAVFVSGVVAATAILVPHTLHKRHMAELHTERVQRAERRQRASGQRQAA